MDVLADALALRVRTFLLSMQGADDDCVEREDALRGLHVDAREQAGTAVGVQEANAPSRAEERHHEGLAVVADFDEIAGRRLDAARERLEHRCQRAAQGGDQFCFLADGQHRRQRRVQPGL